MSMRFKRYFIGLVLMGLLACSDSSQQADPDFSPKNIHQSFSKQNSPVVFIDEAHHNFLTANGRYKPFTQVLESDGYTVKPGKRRLSFAHLNRADILVIANALDKRRKDWNPPYDEAFTHKEVSALKHWVSQGGSLFLVADHAPFPRVIDNLAKAFGFQFSHGHVGNAVFLARNNSLGKHAITSAINNAETSPFFPAALPALNDSAAGANPLYQVRSFGGSAFLPPANAISLLTLGKGSVSVVPEIPFQVTPDTPRVSMRGWSQGAVMEVGKGRIAVFAEGMMFSSQLDTKTGKKYGLVSQGAEQNERFLLNVMRWLAHAT